MLGALLSLIFLASADETGQQVCSLKGEIVLTAPAQYFCMKDMKIADGTRLITQGFPLQITAVGSINYGEPPTKGDPSPRNPGMRIVSFKAPAPQSKAAGPIYIYANTSYGNLEISNRGASDKDLSGDVIIEYVTRGKAYSQSVDVAPGTKVELIVNGYPLEPKKPATAKAEATPTAGAGAAKPGETAAVTPPPKPRKKPVRRVRRPSPRYEPYPQPSPFWNWSW